jgi:predicted methyltransferase MtxX (methanogen marker protein 4)
MEMTSFREAVASLLTHLPRFDRPRIAFGLAEADAEIVASLRKASAFADILIVGPASAGLIKGLEFLQDENPEERIAALLVSDEVHGIIRGTIDDFRTIEAYERLSGEQHTLVPALLETRSGRQFFIEPGSNPEGWTKESRLAIAERLAEFVVSWGIVPSIAVYAGTRRETYLRRQREHDGVIGFLNQSFEEAEWISERLVGMGLKAKNWGIDLTVAIEEGYLIHVPVNGMVGNQTFRGFVAGGGQVLAAPRIGLSRAYEDNSRIEKNFEFHVQFLVAEILRRRLAG